MSVTLSIWSASIGMTSLTSMPGTLVLIGLKSPRTLEGALGLGSQISMWLGPPCRNSMITDLAAPKALPFDSTLAAADAFQERNSGRFKPNKPAPPMRINSRRDQPSQVRTGRPGIVSMCVLLAQDYTKEKSCQLPAISFQPAFSQLSASFQPAFSCQSQLSADSCCQQNRTC